MASQDQARQQVHGMMHKTQENNPNTQNVMKMMASITMGGMSKT